MKNFDIVLDDIDTIKGCVQALVVADFHHGVETIKANIITTLWLAKEERVIVKGEGIPAEIRTIWKLDWPHMGMTETIGASLWLFEKKVNELLKEVG